MQNFSESIDFGGVARMTPLKCATGGRWGAASAVDA